MDEKKTMIREALILFVITLITGVLLGFVHELTKVHVRRFFPTCRTLAFSRFRSNPALNLQKDCLGRG